MMTPKIKNGFTWTELLVLIAVVGFLAAVLIPTVGRVRETSCGGASDASKLRQIGQASLIYADDNREQLPGLHLTALGEIDPDATTRNLHAIAAALARSGGLNDANIWIAQSDENSDVIHAGLTVILDRAPPRAMDPTFRTSALSYQYVAGLTTKMPSHTPIAFTRGLQRDGQWASDPTTSVYGADGGHVVFLGGNVSFYKDVKGKLADRKEKPTDDILEAVGNEARIFSDPPTDTGWLRNGMPGVGP